MSQLNNILANAKRVLKMAEEVGNLSKSAEAMINSEMKKHAHEGKEIANLRRKVQQMTDQKNYEGIANLANEIKEKTQWD